MEYEEIINEIKSNLTDNKEENKKYLSRQIPKYQNHEFSKEIIREIGRLIFESLTEEEKEEYANVVKNENPIKQILDEVDEDLYNQEFESALNKLEEFIKNMPKKYTNDTRNEYHLFNNPLEEILFNENFNSEKEIRLISPEEDYLRLYYIYGALLNEFNNTEKAENALKEAYRLNPVSSKVLIEFSKIAKSRNNSEDFLEFIKKALKYAYEPIELFQLYLNLGQYYIDIDLNLANTLFELSSKYKSFAEGTDYEIDKNKYQNYIETLKNKDIQIGPNEEILTILNYLASENEKNKYFNVSHYFYNIIYNLTRDIKIKEKINEITQYN